MLLDFSEKRNIFERWTLQNIKKVWKVGTKNFGRETIAIRLHIWTSVQYCEIDKCLALIVVNVLCLNIEYEIIYYLK